MGWRSLFMPYEASWLVEGRIVMIVGSGNLSKTDIDRMDADMLAYLEDSDAERVHFIFDASGMVKLPGLSVMSEMRAPKHPAMGWNIVAGDLNRLTRFLVATVARFNRVRFRTFDSVDEAIDFLWNADTTLPESKPGPFV